MTLFKSEGLYEVEKWKQGELKTFSQDHKASKGQSWSLNPGLTDFRA